MTSQGVNDMTMTMNVPILSFPYAAGSEGVRVGLHLLLTATHSLRSSPSGSITASRRFPLPSVAAACFIKSYWCVPSGIFFFGLNVLLPRLPLSWSIQSTGVSNHATTSHLKKCSFSRVREVTVTYNPLLVELAPDRLFTHQNSITKGGKLVCHSFKEIEIGNLGSNIAPLNSHWSLA